LREFSSFLCPVKFATDSISSLFPPRCRLSSCRHRNATTSYHTSFLWRARCICFIVPQRFIPSPPHRVEIEVLNPHHHRRPPSSDCSTPTLHCYEKVISILIILLTTQPCFHFTSSLVRAPCHRSSTRRCCSLLPLSHAHCSSVQRHP
jgi:hypothetical protein